MRGFFLLSGAMLMMYQFLFVPCPFYCQNLDLFSITTVRFWVYELLVSFRQCAFIVTEGVFPRHQYTYLKDWELVMLC